VKEHVPYDEVGEPVFDRIVLCNKPGPGYGQFVPIVRRVKGHAYPYVVELPDGTLDRLSHNDVVFMDM